MFRFTIRDLLWLTVAVAIGTAWWADHRKLLDSLSSAERAIHTVAASWSDEVNHIVKYELPNGRLGIMLCPY